MALQIKRGTNVQRLTLLLAAGEPYFVTDYAGLGVAPMWMGTGSVYGGIPASGGELEDLSDVIYSYLQNNDLLQYNSTLDQWENTADINLAGTATIAENLTVGGNATINGNTTLGNASGDTITVNAATVSAPNGLNIDSDTLIVDSTQNFVGIGIAPTAKLDVSGSIRARGIGITADGNVAVNGGAITTTQTTASVFNTTATTVNMAGAATAVNIGVNGAGVITIPATTESTTPTTGALVVSGGVGIAKKLHMGGTISVDDVTQSTSTSTGSIQTDGGVGIAKNLYVGGDLRILGTTDSSTVDTGSVQIDGGLGVNKNVFIGGYFRVLNNALIDNELTVGGNAIITGNLTVNGTTTTVNSTTLTVDDKNIELGSVATPTNATANGGGITLKNAETGDKSIAWYSASNNWEFSNGVTAPEATFGNVSIASGSNNSTITTTAGNDLYIQTTTARPGAGSAVVIPETSDFKVQATAITLGGGDGPETQISYIGSVITDITFGQPASGLRGIRGHAGGNDFWFVGGGQTGVDQAFLELSTSDNGTEPIYVRQYSSEIGYPWSTLVRTAKLLDESGNTIFPGDLTVTGNDIKSSTGAAALTFNDTNVKVNGELTITGNTIRSSGGNSAFPSGTVALTLSGADVAAQGNLFVENNSSLYVSGQNLVLNNNDVAGGPVYISAYRGVGGATSAIIRWNETTDRWQTTTDSSTYLNIPNQNLDTTDTATFGIVVIDGRAALDSGTLTTSTTTTVPLTITQRNSMSGLVNIIQGANVHCVNFTVLKVDATTALLTTYGELYNTSSLATFTADVSSGDLRLLITPASATSTVFSVVRTSLT